LSPTVPSGTLPPHPPPTSPPPPLPRPPKKGPPRRPPGGSTQKPPKERCENGFRFRKEAERPDLRQTTDQSAQTRSPQSRAGLQARSFASCLDGCATRPPPPRPAHSGSPQTVRARPKRC